ncbi:MAG: EAL domain-containing protein, partial [Chloroflexi bacterium]|nr:EAL domain-containing protein [Chloroflexota bacterium]
EIRMRHADGSWRDFEVVATNLLGQPAIRGIVLNCHDVTERKLLEHQLTELAFHDPLTGLANRALLGDRLEHALARAGRHEKPVGVLLLDLDDFKLVNDSLGHQAGDTLLNEVASRIRTCVRADDTPARLGGDEFAVLLEGIASEADALAVAEKLVRALAVPIEVAGRDVTVGLSVGVALSTTSTTVVDLLRQADLALYRAKAEGKGTCAVFDPSLESRALERLEIENDLRHALQRGELRVLYQPILSLDSRNIMEVEALVRWNHPQRGLLSPAVFIPVAEERGLIVSIGQWVLEQACRQIRIWQQQFPKAPPLVVSVNLSGRQFQHINLVADVQRTLQETGIAPHSLKLEITESVLMRDVEAAVATCDALKRLGVQLAIDDFGTGYSSLGQLKRFPFDALKIDRSFVDGLGQDQHDAAIVRSVVALARTLGLSVTAEGIETALQEAQVRSLGCELGQGFLFSRPQAPDVVASLLAGNDAISDIAA